MPETGGYHIYVHLDDGDVTSPVAGDRKAESAFVKSYGERTEASFEKGLKGLVSFSAIKNTAQKIVTVQTSTINLRTGASEYEQRVQKVTDSVFEGIGTAGALAVGAATGNLPLVAITVATSLFDKLFGVIRRQIEINYKRNVEDVSIRMANVRAGAGGRRMSDQ